MDNRKLLYFVEVAKASSFTKASQKLLIAQPAITKAIQNLEEELQLVLFDRSEKSAILTPEGHVLFQHAQTILEKFEDAEKEMQELRGLHSGEVSIGLSSMFATTHFPKIVKEFYRQYPRLHIRVEEAGTLEIRNLIVQRKVDIGITAVSPPHDELDIAHFISEEVLVCVPHTHPFARRSSVSLEELLTERLILFKQGYYQRKLILETSQKAGITPNIIFSTNQLPLIRSLVAEGVGITLFLNMVVKDDAQLCGIPLSPPVHVHLGVGRKKGTYLSKASSTFLEFLKHYYHPDYKEPT